MRIQWDNLLGRADAISATNADPNYPVSNLYGNTHLTQFMSTTHSTKITATYTEDESVSCISAGNHNISSMILTLRNAADAILFTETYSNSDFIWTSSTGEIYIFDIQYFSKVDGVRKIEIEISNPMVPIEVGGISIGDYLQFPTIAISPSMPLSVTGGNKKTRGGVLFDIPGILLSKFSVTFPVVYLDMSDRIDIFFSNVRTGISVILDSYENLDEYRPYLANVSSASIIRTKQRGQRLLIYRNFKIELEECK